MSTLTKITPSLYLTANDVVAETVLAVADWFETEHISVKVSDAVGEPSPYLPNTSIGWFLSQGWVIDSTSAVRNSSTAANSETFYSDVTYYMSRRRMQSERVLQEMVTSFTRAYNEGRVINNKRYNEIVSLYSVMLSRTEDEMNAVADVDVVELEELVDYIILELKNGFSDFKAKIELAITTTYGTNRINEINLSFDNSLATSKQGLVTRGLYNSTTWESIQAGIEKARQYALNDLNDKLLDRTITTYELLSRVRSQVLAQVQTSFMALFDAKNRNKIALSEMRNRAFQSMLTFMEKREDEYPDMSSLVNIAASLGYGEGSTVAPSS